MRIRWKLPWMPRCLSSKHSLTTSSPMYKNIKNWLDLSIILPYSRDRISPSQYHNSPSFLQSLRRHTWLQHVESYDISKEPSPSPLSINFGFQVTSISSDLRMQAGQAIKTIGNRLLATSS